METVTRPICAVESGSYPLRRESPCAARSRWPSLAWEHNESDRGPKWSTATGLLRDKPSGLPSRQFAPTLIEAVSRSSTAMRHLADALYLDRIVTWQRVL